MDVCNLTYPDSFFDFVLDKSTLDTLLCGDQSFSNTSMMIKEAHWVIKDQGIFFSVSYGKP